MLIRKQLTELRVGSFKDLDQAKRIDRDRDNRIDIEEAYDAYAAVTKGKKPDSVKALYEKLGGARHPMTVFASPENRYSLGIHGGMYSKGGFDVRGLGRGHVLSRHQINYADPNAPAHMVIAFRLDDIPLDVLKTGVKSAAVHFAPKDFPMIAGENIAEVVSVPLDVLVEEGRYYSTGTGGGTAEPEVKALVCAVDRGDLAKLAGDSGGISFYAAVELDDGRSYAINLDGVPGRNFLLDGREEFQGLGDA